MLKRRLNMQRLLLAAVPTAVIAGGVHILHGVQVKRSEALLLKQADWAQEQGDREKTEKYLNRYLGYRPRDSDALARYGLILAEKARTYNDRLQAFLTFEQVLRLDPERRDIRRKAVATAMQIERFSDARFHLEILFGRKTPGDRYRGQELDPESGELEDLFGQCAQGERKYEEAARWYAVAIKHAPAQIDCYVRYANLLRGRLDKADEADRIMDAREIKDGLIAANGQSFRAYVERGHYRQRFRIAGVEQDAARALALAPDEVEALLLAAEVDLDAKNHNAAREHLRHGLEEHSQDGRLYDLLACVETQAEQPNEAEKALKQGIEALPEGEERARLLTALAELLIGQRRHAEARTLIAEDMTRAKIRPEMLQYLGARMLVDERRWLEASRELENVRMRLLMDRPDLAYQSDLFLGRCYERLGETDRRYAAYQRAVAFDPLSIPARLGLAETLRVLGRDDEAIDAYRQVVRQSSAAAIPLAGLLIARNQRLPEPRRNWSEIDQILDTAAKALPDSVDVLILRASALAARGQRQAARNVLVQARIRQPKRVEPWMALASLEGRQDTGTALAVLDEAEKALGDGIELRLARARYWIRRGDKEAAAALTRLAGGLEKLSLEDRRRLLQELANAHRQIGDLAGAKQLLNSLARQEPDDLGPRLTLFDLAIQDGDEPTMTRVLAEIRTIETRTVGEDGTAWRYGRARYLMWQATRAGQGSLDRKALEEARRLLTEISTCRPSWALVPLALAEVGDWLGNPEEAIKNYRKTIELGERRPVVIRRAVELLLARRRTRDAGEMIGKLQENDPDLGNDSPLQRLAAEVALQTGEAARALELAGRAVKTDSKDYHDLLWLGQTLWKAGKREEVEPVLRRAVELGGEVPDVWVAWVQYLVGMNQKEKAEAAIEAARGQLPKEQAALPLARCYAAVGRADQARAQYEQALAARPDDIATLRDVATFELGQSQPQQAELHLRKLIDLQAKSPDEATWARGLLAVLLSARGNQQQAREALKLMGLVTDDSQFRPTPGASD